MHKLWQIPLYAWLAAVFPIASISARNLGQAEAVWIATAIAVALAAATALAIVYRTISKSWSRAGLAVLVTVLVFYGYGPVGGLAEAYWLDASEVVSQRFFVDHAPIILSLSWALLLVAGVTVAVRIREEVALRAAGPLNLAASLLIVFSLAQAAAPGTVAAEDSPLAAAGRVTFDDGDVAADIVADVTEGPDIYVIVLDGYARGDVLSEYYGFDNSAFIGALSEKGFSVIDGSNANYNWTFLSLASSLNMNYLPEVIEWPMPLLSRDRTEPYEAIRDNSVAKFLRRQGYDFVQLQSSWGATKANPHADDLVPCSGSLFTNEYFRAIVEASWLRALGAYAGESLAGCHLTNFESLAALGARGGPKLVFAHFILPHHPYLFDSEGNVLSDATIANQFDFQARLWEDRASYVEQLVFVNRAVMTAVSEILESSAEPPIVLIHSDHGPNIVDGLGEEERLRVRLANFAAYYAPGVDGDLIPDGESPVNYFRHIFNEYFGANLPVLESRYFFSPYRQPYNLSEVTSVVRPLDLPREAK